MTRTEEPTKTAPPTAAGGIGAPVDRVDGVVKTTGAAQYAAEFPYPDLAYAALTHSSVARGRITAIDTAAAAAQSGVLAVLTHENAPAMKPPRKAGSMSLDSLASASSVNYLNTDEVFWDGQPVAVVVADSLDAAAEAAALVTVTYQELPMDVDFVAAEPDATPQKGSLFFPSGGSKGDAEAALATAPISVDHRYTTAGVHHGSIEPHSTTAAWAGDRLTVHESTQSVQWVQRQLAERFDVPVDGVRVISHNVGGGFGGKAMVGPSTILTALAARVVNRPVRMMLTREGVYRVAGGRTPSTQRVALGAKKDGRLTALVHTSVTRRGKVGGLYEPVVLQSEHLYDAENIFARQHIVELDLVPNQPMRAPGESIGTFALESAVDELAHELGMDPIELRMLNEPDRNPIDGKRFARRHLREAYAYGAETFGWSNRSPEAGANRDGRWLVGMGVATAYHPAFALNPNVVMRLAVDGSVVVRCGFHDMGMGGATAQAQIVADGLGVPVESVRMEYGDTDLPTGLGAGGSAQTASIAGSVLAACEKLRRSALRLASRSQSSPLRGRKPEDLEARDGGLFVAAGGAGETYETILARAGRPSIEVRVGSDTGLRAKIGQLRFMGKFLLDVRRWVKASHGAHFCEVRVDADTGEVRVSRWLGVFDVGRVINAKTAASQLRGGVVMGIGMALAEETLVDPRTGRIVNPSLSEYHVPVHADIPRIDIHCLDKPDPTTPLGIMGVGEVGITGVAAAVANAVFNATGRRVRDLPITLDKLL